MAYSMSTKQRKAARRRRAFYRNVQQLRQEPDQNGAAVLLVEAYGVPTDSLVYLLPEAHV